MKFNISTFIQLMMTATTLETQFATGSELLDCINYHIVVPIEGIDKTMINKLVKRKMDVSYELRRGASDPDLKEKIKEEFHKKIISRLNPYTYHEKFKELKDAIDYDSELSKNTKSLLNDLYISDEEEFLFEAFLFAINRPNKKHEEDDVVEDINLLLEFDCRCPNCNELLIQPLLGATYKNYDVFSIFSDKDDQVELEIPLCQSCYKKLTLLKDKNIEDKLIKIKENALFNKEIRQQINNIDITDQIVSVLENLKSIDESELEKDTPLSLSALTINEKIPVETSFLLNQIVTSNVVRYYIFIKEQFAAMDNTQVDRFTLIATTVRLTYLNLAKSKYSFEQIFESLSNWLLSKTCISKEYLPSCMIIISFFVQNCEVFK